MPVTFDDSDIKRSEGLWTALPEDLTVDPTMNGRHDLPDIEWLVQDMLLPHGQIQPVSIRKTAGKPVLTAGFSRWRAAVEINKRGLTPVPFRLWCKYTQLTEQQAFIANISENRVRNVTTELDDAHNIQRLINVYQMSEAQTAEVYHATPGWIRGRLQLLELSPAAETAVRAKRVVGPAVKAIAKLSKDAQAKVLAKPGKITLADVKEQAPAAAPKPVAIDPKVRKALNILLAEAATQPDAMVVEIHRDTIRAVRDAMEGK